MPVRKLKKEKKPGGFSSTSQKGNILHGKLKSQKELKSITGSEEYKKSDYEGKTKMLNVATANKGGVTKYSRGSQGAINPGEKHEERTRTFLKKRQKKAAKIEMVSKLAKRQKQGKYGKSPDGRSKATDTEAALTTFDVQKIMDKRKNPKRDYDSISDRNLSRKEGSMAKGGRVGKKKQGYKDRKDESIAMRIRKKRTARQLKASRDDSYGKFGSKSKKSGKINR